MAISASSDPGRVFYVDNVTGKDDNCGTIRGKAWASLDKVNSMVFQPSDQILFKAGTVYTGQLKPKGSGKEGQPIIIDMYGVGSKPRIDGKGEHLDTVLLENVEYWEVNNLEVTNQGPTRQDWRTGIRVFANSFGTMHHIQLKNLYVHDVNGSLTKETEGCGIIAQCDGKTLSRFDGLLIEDCHLVRTDRNGICMRTEFTNRAKNWFPSLNVVIRGNLVQDCGGDGIKPWGAEGCLVEYNVVRGARERCDDYAAGIWPWSCDNTLIQYNEVSHVNGTRDGQGFDSDYNCRNSIFQYNYSHDNEGGFMLVCSAPVSESNIGCIGSIIRYNISQNDMERIFHFVGEAENTYIYNNVIYVEQGIDVPLVLFSPWSKTIADSTYFYNNIFYADGTLSYGYSTKKLGEGKHEIGTGFDKSTQVVFSNNVYYGNHIKPPEDVKAITADPMLVKPGSGSDGIGSLEGYKLKAGSPCIGAGKSLAEAGILDFWGNIVNVNKPSIGVHEKPGSDLLGMVSKGIEGFSTGLSRPNIVLIYADDIGFGDLACYGASAVKTPNVDRLANEGLQLMNGYASSATCTPSRYTMLTGQYAWRKSGTGILPGDARLIIDPDRMTLPKMLKTTGYRTGIVGKWHLGLGDGNTPVDWNDEIKPGPLEIGFDHSFLIPATGDRVPCVFVEDYRVVDLDPADPIAVSYKDPIPGIPTGKSHRDQLQMDWTHGHNNSVVNGIGRIGYMSGGKAALWKDEEMADKLVEKGVAFIEKNKDKPFFLYFSTHDIHVPRVPHRRFVGKTDMGPRGDAIVQFDWQVGQILDTLDRLNLTENTLVILTSDNGPVLDDGYKDNAVEKLGSHKPAGPLRGGKYSIYDAGTRVPFIVRWPGQINPGLSEALISQVDLVATLARVTGYNLNTKDAPDSLDMMNALLAKDSIGRDHVIEHSQFGTLSIRMGDWKYIEPSHQSKVAWQTGIETGNDPKPQLFNLKSDVGEANNLADEHPEIVRKLKTMLAKYKEEGRSRF